MRSLCARAPPKRDKFQPRAQKGVMVGYRYSSKDCRIWTQERNTVIDSKHVVFDEQSLTVQLK